ncbi:MAG: hypothetical protein EXQ80_05195 [Candidatus Nanopelagicaceae bacterium]|nr:hypothetical protein [Candidatus Nanopelagicaceae bacterium]
MRASTTERSERIRIARDLHDGIAQELVALGYSLDKTLTAAVVAPEVKAQLREVRSQLTNLTNELRAEIFFLRNSGSQNLGQLLQSLIGRLEKQHEIKIATTIPLGLTLDEDLSYQIYRIIQEVLTNSIKHADSTQIQMQLKTSGNKLELLITDQATPAEYEQVERDPNTFGLIGIQERAVQIGADCEWVHELQSGLRFTLSVNLN